MIEVIIPVHNLLKRGLPRVYNSCYSLENQDCKVTIVDSSTPNNYNMLGNMLVGLDVNHVFAPNNEFNKPKLLNTGMKLSKADYFICTDADYLFRADLIETIKRNVEQDVYH